ncbi:MAG TPA: MlaD family protein [Geobacterales bacterium]|nr:MlaD family protein [Geobacterales bacterium]
MALTIEKKVGLFFIIALIIFGVLLELGEKWNPFEHKLQYKTYFGGITGLKVGDPVRLSGVDVGQITKISIEDSKVRVDFEVAEKTRVKSDSEATIRMTNLLGGQFLALSFGSEGASPLEDGGTVASREMMSIDAIVDTVGRLTKDAEGLVKDLNRNQNEVMGKISAMLDENRAGLKNSIHNIESITAKIDHGDGSLALLLNDKTLYTNVRDLSADLKLITGKINRGEGTLGKLVNDDTLYNEATGAITSINEGMKDVKEIAAKINRGDGTVGKLVNDEALYVEVRDAARNIKEITAKINNGQGTIGKLVNEDTLYRDATAAMKKTERAMEGLGDSGPISVVGTVVGTLF